MQKSPAIYFSLLIEYPRLVFNIWTAKKWTLFARTFTSAVHQKICNILIIFLAFSQSEIVHIDNEPVEKFVLTHSSF